MDAFQLGDLWRSRSMASSWSARAGVFNDKMLRLAKAISGPARLHVFCHPSMGVGAPTVKRRTRLVGRAEAWRRSGGDPKPQSHQTGPPALRTACVPTRWCLRPRARVAASRRRQCVRRV